MRFRVLLATSLVGAQLATGCGSDDSASRSSSTPAATSARNASLPPALAARLTAAEHPRVADFSAAGGRSLESLAERVAPGPQVGLAASVLLPGENRVAFGLIGADNRFVYGRSALYVATSPTGPAQGPFLAPADSFVPSAPFLSETAAADTADTKAIYATQLTFKQPGSYAILAVSKVGSRLLGAA